MEDLHHADAVQQVEPVLVNRPVKTTNPQIVMTNRLVPDADADAEAEADVDVDVDVGADADAEAEEEPQRQPAQLVVGSNPEG